MPDLQDGESVEMQGSGSRPYVLKNVGGVYSCSCPAWRNQSVPIERRTCKHLRKLRGDAAEETRIGGDLPPQPQKAAKDDGAAPALLLAESWNSFTDPGRLVAERKARRRPGVLGRQAALVAAWQSLPCSGLVCHWAARCTARW